MVRAHYSSQQHRQKNYAGHCGRGEEKGKDKGRCGRGEEKGKDKGRCGSTTSKNGQICRSKVSSRQPRTLNKENPGSNHIAAFSKL